MAMGNNPYAPPSAYGPSGNSGREYALNKVRPVALTMLIVTGVMMALVLVGIILNFLGVGFAAANNQQAAQFMLQGTVGIISGFVGLAVGGVVIYGCMQMMKLESYGFAMAACIISMIPCISPCCVTGIPLGIWGIMVLGDPQVKAAFTS
jgi:hypothetical protein